MFTIFHLKTGLFLAALLFVAAFFTSTAFAADTPNGMWRDSQGITVDAANRNADAIRRSQSREQRNINQLHEVMGIVDRGR